MGAPKVTGHRFTRLLSSADKPHMQRHGDTGDPGPHGN